MPTGSACPPQPSYKQIMRMAGLIEMTSDMPLNLSDCRLYGILDLGYVRKSDATHAAEAMIKGGVDLIQLRGKEKSIEELVELAAELHELTARLFTPLIMNDHAEIARRVPVEGVHVGQDDDSIQVVRRKAGRDILVGKSTHSLKQALAAQREGADYIGFGPIFATRTKPDYVPIGLSNIKQVHGEVSLPIFCIGGIKIDNLEQVIAAGAHRVAIVSGLLKASDIVEYARACKKLLT
jgi:thiamine-phosphate pyrophosphorylase